MVKNRIKPTKERKCRNNIATFLSLMGFQDENPAATIKIILSKLKKIQEKSNVIKKPAHLTFKKVPVVSSTFKKPAHSTLFKKPVVSSTFKKVTFKCGGKTTTVSLKPDHSFGFTTIGDHNNNYMETADSRNNDNNKKIVSCSKSTNLDQIMNDVVDEGCMGLHNFIKSIGGSEARMVIEKELTPSDVTKGLGRLLIPRTKVKNSGFLTSDEKRKLGKRENISVSVFDLKRRESTVNFAQWNMNKEVYVLKTGWNNIVKENGLRQGMVIKVWAFRVDERLCLALN